MLAKELIPAYAGAVIRRIARLPAKYLENIG
jgi:hypothetical protein